MKMSGSSEDQALPIDKARGTETGALSHAEEHILRCLGGALVEQWSSLPTNVQRTLFARAATLGAPKQSPHLKQHIASFLRARRSDTGTLL